MKLAALILTLAFSTSTFACFDVENSRGVDDGRGFFTVTGSLKNNCGKVLGPEMQATIFDKNGIVIDTQDFWPASTRNISPGTSIPFKWQFNVGGQPKVVRYRVQAIAARVWN